MNSSVSTSSILKLFKFPDLISVMMETYGYSRIHAEALKSLSETHQNQGPDGVASAVQIDRNQLIDQAVSAWGKAGRSIMDTEFHDYYQNIIEREQDVVNAIVSLSASFDVPLLPPPSPPGNRATSCQKRVGAVGVGLGAA